MASPRLYSTFLLWLLSELFELLPEIGDADKPKLAFFFDEAHLLFDDAPPALLEKVEQVVRLIRSKGVGVYFITQNPIDIPDKVAGQLGNRVQHALRRLHAARPGGGQVGGRNLPAQSRRSTSRSAITELKVGEALVSLLQPDGAPSPVERTLIKPPRSRVGPLTAQERAVLVQTDAIGAKYDTLLDRDSAEEILKAKGEEAAAAAAAAKAQNEAEKAAAEAARQQAIADKEAARQRAAAEARAAGSSARRSAEVAAPARGWSARRRGAPGRQPSRPWPTRSSLGGPLDRVVRSAGSSAASCCAAFSEACCVAADRLPDVRDLERRMARRAVRQGRGHAARTDPSAVQAGRDPLDRDRSRSTSSTGSMPDSGWTSPASRCG